jgi:hypothetical protein
MPARSTVSVTIQRRPWYEWVLWAAWLLLELFLLQNALASAQEFEPRASAIFWVLFAVFLAAGGIVWLARRSRLPKA